MAEGMASVKAELARQVLDMFADSRPVPAQDAVQLRNWAIRPEEAMLPLEEIAQRILKQQEAPKAKAARQR